MSLPVLDQYTHFFSFEINFLGYYYCDIITNLKILITLFALKYYKAFLPYLPFLLHNTIYLINFFSIQIRTGVWLFKMLQFLMYYILVSSHAHYFLEGLGQEASIHIITLKTIIVLKIEILWSGLVHAL